MAHQLLSCAVRLGSLAIGIGILSACSSLSTPKQSPAKLLEQTRSSIITSSAVSAATRSVLLSSGYAQDSCMADFDECVQAVKASFLSSQIDRQMLATLSELYYAQAQYLSSQDACRAELDRQPVDAYYANAPLSPAEKLAKKQAQAACFADYRHALYQTLRTSYAYVFFYDLGGAGVPSPIPQESDVRTLDFYHLAINDLVTQLYRGDDGVFGDTQQIHHALNTAQKEPIYQQIRLLAIDSQDRDGANHLNVSITNDPYYIAQMRQNDGTHNAFSELVSAYDSRLTHLDAHSRRSGLGVSFIGAIQSRHTANALPSKNQAIKPNKAIADRIHTIGHLQLTALITPRGNSIEQVLNTRQFDGYLFNPQHDKQIDIKGTNYPLAANFSASYALWLNENQLQQVSLMNMVSRHDAAVLPELFMLKPFDRHQKVIIMLHGLASSPATWVNLTNTLLVDATLNDNYQVWQIAYSTNLPILENRYHIEQLIRQAFASVDPKGDSPASHDAIIIGHSMGGVIARMLVSDDDLSANLDQLSDDKQAKLLDKLPDDQKQTINQRLKLSHLPQVNTAIFLSAPFRGTDYADRWFTRAARRIIRLPLDLTKAARAIVNVDSSNQSVLGALYLQNGASQLSDRSAFMALTSDIKIHPQVSYHTIVGDNSSTDHQNTHGDAVGAAISDGIVPYHSSHLDGAASETIIQGKHNIHEHPKTIAQLRKILHNHLKNSSDN
ncbi:alpha/beta fold hydrolase [Moraxella marmotae]|uniref:alpha/beta fold hydrolase n=1 Tax=Moraxella marmotae TaxID=3344520 RepID=UPI0035F47519